MFDELQIKIMWSLFKVIMLIYQSKAKLDVKILFGKMTYILNPEIRKMLQGEREFHSSILVWSIIKTKTVKSKRFAHEFFFSVYTHRIVKYS